ERSCSISRSRGPRRPSTMSSSMRLAISAAAPGSREGVAASRDFAVLVLTCLSGFAAIEAFFPATRHTPPGRARKLAIPILILKTILYTIFVQATIASPISKSGRHRRIAQGGRHEQERPAIRRCQQASREAAEPPQIPENGIGRRRLR